MVEALEGAESLDAPIGDGDEGEALTLADVVADPCADVTSPTERRDYARWLMTQIAPRQAFALKAFYGVNMTAIPDAEAAAELGVKPARLRTLRHDGCESARKVAASQYWVPLRHEYGRTLAPAA
jgi:RNA polymerase primary sigma factor